MLRPKRFQPPPGAGVLPPSPPRLPDWALVLIGLAVILLAATALASIASYRSPPDSAAQEPPAGQATAATVTAPAAAATAATPGTPWPAGVVVLAATAPAATETPAPPETPLPAEVLLQEVPIGKQTRPLNCEFQTASDLAWYYGRPFTWEEIYQYVGHDVGGNPHKGFVGRSFDDRPGQLYPLGYGVYAEPIAQAFAQFGLLAEVSYANSAEWLMAQLAAGRPVMVWATSEMTIRPVATWTAADGVVVKGVPGEHTYLAVGYDAGGVWLIDPWNGQRRYFEWAAFLASWDLLDRMALVVTGEAPVR